MRERDQAREAEVNEALTELLPTSERTGDRRTDLLAAAHEALRRRKRNSYLGGVVIAALHDEDGENLSWQRIYERTGITPTTARRWANPPE